MKTVLGWLSDPFVHIAIVAIVLIRLAMNWSGEADSVQTARYVPTCMACRARHESDSPCRFDSKVQRVNYESASAAR